MRIVRLERRLSGTYLPSFSSRGASGRVRRLVIRLCWRDREVRQNHLATRVAAEPLLRVKPPQMRGHCHECAQSDLLDEGDRPTTMNAGDAEPHTDHRRIARTREPCRARTIPSPDETPPHPARGGDCTRSMNAGSR